MGEPDHTDFGLRVFSLLVSGLAFYGGLGWLFDRWQGTSWGLPVGIIVGAVAGVYMVIARYGRSK